jgi:hypothetical protein
MSKNQKVPKRLKQGESSSEYQMSEVKPSTNHKSKSKSKQIELDISN